MNSWERRAQADRAVSQLVRMAEEASSDTLTPSEQDGFLRLESAIAERKLRHRGRTTRPWRFQAAGLAAAAAIAAIALFFVKYRTSVQAFEVANGSVGSGGYIRPTAPEGARVRFGDGSEVVLESGARTKVADVYAHGARILLEDGKARLRVMPVPGAKWLVEAGPYTIQVTGTVFDVAWMAPEENLDLWLREGSVVVTGPLTTQGFVMRAGQHLVARARESLLLLDGQPSEDFRARSSDIAGDAPVREVAAPAPAGVAKAPRAAADGRAPGAGAAAEGRTLSWSKRLAAGDFEGILADADRRGFDGLLSKVPRAELGVLADAARYARRFDWARRALLAERERFPGSAEANDAAFFLGGLAESDAAPVPSALEWYERYLAESPQGTYASQALGRKLMIVHRLRGREAAKPLALGYLNQYPKGPYARYAKTLLETNAVK